MFALLPTLASSHEVWLDPLAYKVEAGAQVAAELKNGQNFNGGSSPYNGFNFARFDRIHKGVTTAVTGRLGDRPAFKADALEPGLHVVVYQSKPTWLRYAEWAKFQKFADHKDFPDIEARHKARDLPREGFAESYTRFAKTLIAVGDGAGSDVATGMETEIIALTNPYTQSTDGRVKVRVLYQGAPRGHAQIELFERNQDGAVEITLHRTNDAGEAALPVKPGHSYLVDAVLLREPVPGERVMADAVWESLWASLTFAVPAR